MVDGTNNAHTHEDIVVLRKRFDEQIKELSDLKVIVAENTILIKTHDRRLLDSISIHEFTPVKKIVYTMAGVVLISVLAALIKLVLLGG